MFVCFLYFVTSVFPDIFVNKLSCNFTYTCTKYIIISYHYNAAQFFRKDSTEDVSHVRVQRTLLNHHVMKTSFNPQSNWLFTVLFIIFKVNNFCSINVLCQWRGTVGNLEVQTLKKMLIWISVKQLYHISFYWIRLIYLVCLWLILVLQTNLSRHKCVQ